MTGKRLHLLIVFYVILMSLVFHSYVPSCVSLVWHSYVTRMSFVCHWYVIHMLLICTCMSLVCTHISFIFHSNVNRMSLDVLACHIRLSLHILVCHPYVTCMNSYVIRLWLVYHSYATLVYSRDIHMSLVCTRNLICISLVYTRIFVWHWYVTRMSLVCHLYVTLMYSLAFVCHSYVLVWHLCIVECHSYLFLSWTRGNVFFT